MTIPSGKRTLTVTLYEKKDGQGNKLSTATTTVTIAKDGYTQIPITLGGVVAKVAVSILGQTSYPVTVGIATSVPLTVAAYDASGSLIIPPGDYATPVTLTDNDQSGSTSFRPIASDSHGQHGLRSRPFVATTVKVNAPDTGATLYYDGGNISSATITPSINGSSLSGGSASIDVGAPDIVEYSLPASSSSGLAVLASITEGADGALWFTEESTGAIGRITTNATTANSTITQYTRMDNGSRINIPTDITAGPDGALWFIDNGNSAIGRITTSGVMTEYTTPIGSNSLNAITAGSDGALWFTDADNDAIGRITTAASASNSTITEYPLPPSEASNPEGITAGPDGALWFVHSGPSQLGRITTAGIITEYSAGAHAFYITTGPDADLWAPGGGSLARITTSGAITTYTYPQGESTSEAQITTGSDGALWFTECNGLIGRATVNGTLSAYAIPRGTAQPKPIGITNGPDGNIWFTDFNNNAIGRLYVKQQSQSREAHAR